MVCRDVKHFLRTAQKYFLAIAEIYLVVFIAIYEEVFFWWLFLWRNAIMPGLPSHGKEFLKIVAVHHGLTMMLSRHRRRKAGLAIFESGFALFNEGGHAFFLVFHGEGSVEVAAFEQQAFLQAGFIGAVDQFLDHHGDRQ